MSLDEKRSLTTVSSHPGTRLTLLSCATLVLYFQGLGLVFVAVYQKALSLMYVDELLYLVKQDFTAHYYKPNVRGCPLCMVPCLRIG